MEINLTIAEFAYQVSTSGELVIPSETIADMMLKPGDTINVAFISKNGKANDFRELFLSEIGLEGIKETESSIQIPTQLLEQANISVDSDLQIACFDGLIVICKAESLELEELSEIYERMKIAQEFVEYYDYGESLSSIKDQLIDVIRYYEESGDKQ